MITPEAHKALSSARAEPSYGSVSNGFLTVLVSVANHLTERAEPLTHSLEVQDWPTILACDYLEHHGYKQCCSPQDRKREVGKGRD